MSDSTDQEQPAPDGDAPRGGAGNRQDDKKPADNKPPDQSDDQKKEEPHKKKRRPSPLVILIGLAVLLAVAIAAFFIWRYSSTHEGTDDAYITGHEHQISSRVSGTVTDVLVNDNQLVHAGQVLVKLDPRDYEVALQKAQAALAQAQAQTTAAEAAQAQARADTLSADARVTQANAQFEIAGVNYNRNSSLFQKDMKAVAKQDVDTTKANLDAENAALDSAKAQAQASRANEQSTAAQVTVAQANVRAAEAQVHDAELELSYTSVLAPVEGHVSRKTVESGQRIQPGQALMAVVEANVWVLANMKETQLKKIEVGQAVDIKIDTLKGMTFLGVVDSIQNGSGATFSLLPPDNATGNFTKIVQRVPVKIVFDEESIRDFHAKIVPGLSVEPEIDLNSLRDHRHEDKEWPKIQKQNREHEEGKGDAK